MRTLLCMTVLFVLAPWLGYLIWTPTLASAQVFEDPQQITAVGVSHSSIESQIDALVRDLMMERNLPGMSVAVTQYGRLLHTKGYGWADASEEESMWNDSRIRIGSVGKAVVTGPAAYTLLRAKGIDAKTKRLYGTAGVLGTGYAVDMARGTRRHTPIVAVAISPEDRVYAWYTDGTVSSGTSSDLDARSAPKTYSLPPGADPVDIRAIAIARNSRVYVWYDDRTRSVGTSTDLDRYSAKGVCNNDDKSGCVSLPPGKAIEHVVGAAIAKSNDHVYVWYEDGTVSSGTSMDFDRYFKPKPFSAETTQFSDIRGVGIAKNDHVYAWDSSNKARSGTSGDLDHYRSQYNYSYAPSADEGGPHWPSWYSKITLQHLLDHESGFTRSGDTGGAAAMFGVDEDDLTYDQAHRHFLRTRKLLFEPGTEYSYSNHGFGLWTLLVEKISGMPFRTYVQKHYLAPRGLESFVVPESANRREKDALPHRCDASGCTPVSLKESRLGLAAGGFLASAQDLTRLMASLHPRFSDEALDDMGWGMSAAKFSHGGLRDPGGTAFVAMFRDGYHSKRTGDDLSRIHVAAATNAAVKNALSGLVDEIALVVAAADVPDDHSIQIDGSSWPVGDPTPQVDSQPELTGP